MPNAESDVNHIDMIAKMGIPNLPSGVQGTTGMCGDNRNGFQVYPYPAYSLDNNTMITVATAEIFPNGFPFDFSIIITIRPRKTTKRSSLFSIYSSQNEKVLELMIADDVRFYYQDLTGDPLLDDDTTSFGVQEELTDNKYINDD